LSSFLSFVFLCWNISDFLSFFAAFLICSSNNFAG
jgi:hypothetical protein